MATYKRSWAQLSATLLCALSVACGSDGGGGVTPAAGTGGTPPATGGTGAAGSASGKVCINSGDVNAACQPVLKNEPSSGDCAPHGVCCHRASNSAKAATLGADDPLEIEYRLNYSLTINHPKTIGSPIAVTPSLNDASLEAQNLLWRLKVPRMGGKEVSGKGEFTPGYGTYNCDGTYSLYGQAAAPNGALSNDPKRWFTNPTPITVDVTKTGADRYHTAFADAPQARQFINVPYVDTSKTNYPLDWELSTMGFRLIDITEDAGHDCAGTLGGGVNGWTAAGHYETYSAVLGNNKSIITSIGVTYCTLVSFGLGAAKGLNCETEPRCLPDSMDASGKKCPWVKLPDSYCPLTATEQGLFNCHLAAKGNPNKETPYPTDADLKCTDTAPTTIVDPDAGATTTGQCCDPLGVSTTLPACNAHRLIQEFVASGAEITTATTDKLQANCSAQ